MDIHTPQQQPIHPQEKISAGHRLAPGDHGIPGCVQRRHNGKAALPGQNQTGLHFFRGRPMPRRKARIDRQLFHSFFISAMETAGVQIAAQDHGNSRKSPVDFLQQKTKLPAPAFRGCAVFQMGTYNAKLFSLHIQPGQDGLAAAGALLGIIKPILRYRKRHGLHL